MSVYPFVSGGGTDSYRRAVDNSNKKDAVNQFELRDVIIPPEDISLSSVSVGGQSIVANGTVPDLQVKGIKVAGGLSIASSATDITITGGGGGGSTSNLGLAGGATGQSIVVNGTGPALSVKGITGGSGVTVTTVGTDLEINVAGAGGGGATALQNAGVASGTQSIVNTGTAPTFRTKGIVGIDGITVTSNSTDVIVSSDISTAVTMFYSSEGTPAAEAQTFSGSASTWNIVNYDKHYPLETDWTPYVPDFTPDFTAPGAAFPNSFTPSVNHQYNSFVCNRSGLYWIYTRLCVRNAEGSSRLIMTAMSKLAGGLHTYMSGSLVQQRINNEEYANISNRFLAYVASGDVIFFVALVDSTSSSVTIGPSGIPPSTLTFVPDVVSSRAMVLFEPATGLLLPSMD